MCLKKIISGLVIATIFIMSIIVPRETYAEQLPAGQKVYMGIQKLMSSNDPKMGYGINQPGLNNGAYIWNIVKYDSSTATTYTQDNIYCVKAGVGFTTSSGTERREPYDVFYNMKTERDKIKAQNAILSGLVDGTVTGVNRYNAILAILDRLYLPGESTENEKRQLVYNVVNCAMTDNDYLAYRDYGDLLEQAFNLPAGKDIVDLILENSPTKYALTEYALTDNDIKAVQQAVLWYFTNSEEAAKYDKTSSQNWLHYTLDGNDYSHTLNEYTQGGKQVGLARNVQAEILYNYMIRQAKANANNYANSGANAGAPAQVDTKTLNGDIAGNNYIIGPIHMTQLNSTPYTIDFKVKNNGTEITNYQLLDENQRAVAAGTTIKNLVGKNFYISVPKNQVEAITIDIKVNYNDTTMTLWASSTNNQEQPLVEVHKGEISVPVELRFTPKKITGQYGLKIIKVDSNNENKKLSGAVFTVNKVDKVATNGNGETVVESNKAIESDNQTDIYTITEKTAPTGYNKFEGAIEVTVKSKLDDGKYVVDTEKTTMTVKDKSGNVISENVPVKMDKTTGLITITVKDTPVTGSYGLKIIKVDSNDENKKLSGAVFTVNKVDKTATNGNGETVVESNKAIESDNQTDIYTITEKTAPTGYNKFEGTIEVTVKSKLDDGKYVVDTEKTTMTVKDKSGNVISENVPVKMDKTTGLITITVQDIPKSGNYGLKIVKVDSNDENKKLSGAVFTVNKVDKTATNENGETVVESNKAIESDNQTDIYTITEKTAPTGYNKFEGAIEVTVKSKLDDGKYVVDTEKTTMTVKDKSGNVISENIPVKMDKTTGLITITVQDTPKSGSYSINLVKEDSEGEQIDSQATFEVNGVTKDVIGKLEIVKKEITGENVSTEDIYVIKETKAPDEYCKFKGEITVTVSKEEKEENYTVKEITYKVTDEEGKDITSDTNEDVKVYLNEDGNIFVEVKNYEFDLALKKRIAEVNGNKVPNRIKSVDVSKLNTLDENGNKITTADYDWDKTPVLVKKGDIVTYIFRIYNEGSIDGYASEITEDIPEGLEYLWDEGIELNDDGTINWDNVTTEFTEEEKKAIEFNLDYNWSYKDKDLKTIKTDYLSRDNENVPGDGSNLIKAFDKQKGFIDTESEKNPDYKEVSIKLKVVSENIATTPIRNEAAITEDTDEDGNPVDDRDSHTDEWHEHPDHEDDEDHDYIILQSFDLALRKFIIAVSNDTKIENNEYLKNEDGSYTRAPVVDTSELNTEDETGKLITTAKYNHTKEPVMVSPNAIVVYMLRVYNEGDTDGYASEIKDHLPPYLEYVDDEFNKQYGWEVSEDGRTVTTRYLAQDKFLINKATKDADGKIELSYKEVPIMCKVKENAKTSENITNIADITEYLDKNKQPAVDRDSQEDNVDLPKDKDLPGYKENEKGSYVPGQQDDDDFEKVVIKIFDLALRKWVTQAIVIENGQQTVTQTGHDAWDEPEAVVKVELHKKKLNQVTVKFKYSIRVYNQGEIEGYAKEVTDYIPEGLKFVAEDNKGWKDEGNNIISTRLLENTLLQPGEYADVEVLLTWVNNENNMGVMNNIAEISEDYNKYGVPDIDSTPDNKKQGEDDIDDAPVMLSISTGQMRIYFTLGFIILITTAGGVILIKKFVL